MDEPRPSPLFSALLSLFLPGTGQLCNLRPDPTWLPQDRRTLAISLLFFGVWCAGWITHTTVLWMSTAVAAAVQAGLGARRPESGS